ncbi:NAD(P)-dependent dehydrogenase (short-subunit alcohol dehydrogenase family) [Alicyclobacillus sacchari]|uniref:NAD(P)-dependent dehydrogenase (Short-subunit alcohol dehydrogenase family) n=1 Tax=Alicyclobacillus sacchari TaxID=392010 RepID=A0A4R8LIA0_9BACL|nr:SDR family oxidoreductase [Alicyclobacillus sacchari]TDY43026.1 NAD(P)-dependent dehydrogenase (short-subunit alcohol dehydrogenase family) [Alicyclobacillus sacchari]GMA57743.1 short-chain dehydrogenase [Alicyclobacillus sacchari]
MDLCIHGKVAIVTGGSKGIGLQTARLLALEGARVAICARTESVLQTAAASIEQESGVEVLAIPTDVRDPAACRGMIEEVHRHFGRIDILINNAGTANARPFLEVDDDNWRGDLDLKLFAAIHCSRAAVPYMQQQGGGSIVHVAAVGGKTPGASSMPSSVSRAAGLALTKAMSKDLGPLGIRVNAVCIGQIRSDQIERMWQQAHPDLTWDEFARLPQHGIPLGRIGDTDEAARVIAFLASDAASYITGTALNIDGGLAPAL